MFGKNDLIFSKHWKKEALIFQTLETFSCPFSKHWKKCGRIFQTLEKTPARARAPAKSFRWKNGLIRV